MKGKHREAVPGRAGKPARSAPDPVIARRRQRVLALFEAGMKPKQILDPVRADFGDHVSLAVVYNDIKWLRAEGAVAKPDSREASTGGSAALGSRDQGPILARRRELVRALFDKGMKPRQIAEQVRREFGANLRINLVYRDITWLRANGMINSQDSNKARDEDLDRRCVELKQAGRSYEAIAEELGISRGAVAGRFHRMGQRETKATGGKASTKPVTRRPARPRRHSPAAKRRCPADWSDIEASEATPYHEGGKAAMSEQTSVPVIVASQDTAYSPGAPTAVMTARPGTCRWPIGEPRAADFRFCGAKALDGSSWCADCAARAWPTSGGTS